MIVGSFLAFCCPRDVKLVVQAASSLAVKLRDIKKETISFWGVRGRPHEGRDVCPCPKSLI